MSADVTSFPSGSPRRFTIIPDDYHVPYAGRTGDGRLFFLSEELFGYPSGSDESRSYVGLFLWKSDGAFDEVRCEPVARPQGYPPMQGVPAGDEDAVDRWLATLGDYELVAIEVAPFAVEIDGLTFGFVPDEFEGQISITVQPGDFIAYYEPWDGEEYDT